MVGLGVGLGVGGMVGLEAGCLTSAASFGVERVLSGGYVKGGVRCACSYLHNLPVYQD